MLGTGGEGGKESEAIPKLFPRDGTDIEKEGSLSG